jgi:hypothetical protein
MVLSRRVLCCFVFLCTWPAVDPNSTLGLSTVTIAEAQETVKVWLNTRSGVYHCPGSRYYGATKTGMFVLEAAARAAGHHPAYGQSCGPSAGPDHASGPQLLRVAAPETPVAAGVKVWVNTNSGVYHCPGSRYYGNTKAGQFMSEPDARATGNHPAYGRACG